MESFEMTPEEKLAFMQYFREKFSLFYKTQKAEEAQNKMEELENMLVARLRTSDDDEMNLMDFSSDSDSSENDEDSSSEEERNLLQETCKKSDGIFRGAQRGELCGFSEGSTDVFDCPEPQDLSPFLQFKNARGQHYCSLCKWAPSNNSTEDFLVHLKTYEHVTKLKNRFMKDNFQGNEEVTTVQQRTENKNKGITFDIESQKAAKKKRKRKSQMEKGPENYDERKNLRKKNLAKSVACIQPITNELLKCNLCNKLVPKSSELPVLMKNLAAHLQSKGHLSKMEKAIKTSEIEINLPDKGSEQTNNIQSTNPVQKSVKTANPTDQKNAKIANPPTQQKNSKTANPTDQKNTKIANPSTQKNGKTANPTDQKNAKIANPPTQKNVKTANPPTQQKNAKTANPPTQQKNAKTANLQAQKNIKSISVHNHDKHCNSDSNGTDIQPNKLPREKKKKEPCLQTQYQCLPCNHVMSNMEVFRSHIISKEHEETLMKSYTKKIQMSKNIVTTNITDCKICKRQLLGSSFAINEHFSKCQPQK